MPSYCQYVVHALTPPRLFTNFLCVALGAVLLWLVPLGPLAANSLASQTAPFGATPRSDAAAFIEVGRGEMDWLWFSLYKARLMTLNGRYQPGQYPLILDIEYYRDIAAKDLLSATQDQWQHLHFPEQDIRRWLGLLTAVWPDVKSGDHLSFNIIDGQTSQFFFNQQPLTQIEDPNFAEAFLAIWLSPHTSRPDLRAQLLGEKSCDC
ncbi:MAG: chalcone isomerase family protein [Shewanella sp.]